MALPATDGVGVEELGCSRQSLRSWVRQAEVDDEVGKGARAAAALVQTPDRTPDEVAESAEADREARGAVDNARRMLDLWPAGPLGWRFRRSLRAKKHRASTPWWATRQWEEVTVEELAFYARYKPGIRALSQRPREEAIATLKRNRPSSSTA